MGEYKRKDQVRAIPLHPPQAQMLKDILSRISERELDLMRRAHKLTKPPSIQNNPPKNDSVILAHALMVGLTQLSQAFNPDESYHYSFQGGVTTILHDAIRSEHKPELLNRSTVELDQAEIMISRFEEMRAAQAIIDKLPKPPGNELHDTTPSDTTDNS